MNSEWQALCLDRMKKIIDVYGEQSELANISEDQIQEAYKNISEEQILVPGTGARKIKSLLCNLDNLRMDFKSRAEPLLFEKWYNSYKEIAEDSKTIETGEVQPENAEHADESEVAESLEREPEIKKDLVNKEASADSEPEQESVEPESARLTEEEIASVSESELKISETESEEETPKSPEQKIFPESEAGEKGKAEAETLLSEPEPDTERVAGKSVEKTPEVSAEEPETSPAEKIETAGENREVKSPGAPVFFKKRKEDLFDKFLNIVARFMSRFVQWE